MAKRGLSEKQDDCIPCGHDDLHLQFTNCRVLRNGKLVKDDLWVSDGVIVNGQDWFYTTKAKATRVIDCKNRILAPGYIDLQLNGGYGHDFTACETQDDLRESLQEVAKKILATGVTMFCPTVISSDKSTYSKVIPVLNESKKPGGKHGAEILGAHLEGPFIALKKKGAHNVKHIDNCQTQFEPIPKPCSASGGEDTQDDGMEVDSEKDAEKQAKDDLELCAKRKAAALKYLKNTYGDFRGIQIVTLAPELPFANDMVQILRNEGVVVSLGHSIATLAEAECAVNAGGTLITHLFNAMAAFHHRDPGIVGTLSSAAVEKRPFYGIIADGFHTHDAAIRMAYNTHPDGIVLVTDAMAAMGLGAGMHSLGDMKVCITEDHKVTLQDAPETLAGSATTMEDSVKKLASIIGVCPALEAASNHPARVLGIDDKKGILLPGHDADIVMLSDDLSVHATYIAGQLTFAKNEHKAQWFYAKPPSIAESPSLSKPSTPRRSMVPHAM